MPKPLAADFVCLGMTVLSVKLPRLGGRQDESTEDALTKSAQWRGDTLMGQMMKKLVLGVDALLRFETVDPRRIASVGFSTG